MLYYCMVDIGGGLLFKKAFRKCPSVVITTVSDSERYMSAAMTSCARIELEGVDKPGIKEFDTEWLGNPHWFLKKKIGREAVHTICHGCQYVGMTIHEARIVKAEIEAATREAEYDIEQVELEHLKRQIALAKARAELQNLQSNNP